MSDYLSPAIVLILIAAVAYCMVAVGLADRARRRTERAIREFRQWLDSQGGERR